MLIMKAVSPANSLASVAVLFCLFISGGNGRPYEEQASPISEDTSSRYEVYIPDGTGEMAQQLLTLPEIRTLLARQADDEEVQSVPYNENRANIVSLEGGKRLVETVPLPDAYASRIGVSDVVSSVRSIMASEMAQHEQQQNKVHVVQAETSPEEENDATPSEESQTDVVMTDVAAPEATEESLEATPVESAMEEAAVRQDNHLHEEHHGEHHGDHHGDHHGEHHEHHGDHHGEHHEHHDEHHHHHEHHHPAAVFEPLPKESVGLLATSSAQDQELTDLTSSSNKIAWQVWSNSVKEQSIENNQVFSPLALTSALGISFLGARGTSAEAIDTVLGLDRFKSRNPHLHLQQVAKDVDIGEHFQSTQAHTVFVDEKKGAVQDIFRARLDTLYGAATTSNLSHVQRMVSSEYPVRQQDEVDLRAPFGIISTANLNVAWPSLTVPADQQEEYLQFLNLPSAAQVAAGRKLVSVPTIRTAGHFYAGYNNELDATTVAIPLHPVRDGEATTWAPSDALDQAGHLSLVLVMPGSASKFQAGGSGLADLESRLASQEDGWDHLLRQTKPYHLLVEMPKLSDTNRLNLTSALKSADSGRLATIFDPRKADFSGISSAKPLYLSDVIQLARLNISSVASLTGDEPTGRSTDAKKKTAVAGKQGTKAKPSKVQVTVKSPCKEAIEAAVAAAMDAHIKKGNDSTGKKTRTERQTTEDKLQHISFNRAFTYAVRHNPTGLLLMIGRYVHPEE